MSGWDLKNTGTPPRTLPSVAFHEAKNDSREFGDRSWDTNGDPEDPIIFETTELDTGDITESDGVYTLPSTGIYFISPHITLGVSTGVSGVKAQVWLERSTGGPFTEISGSRGYYSTVES